MKSIRHITPEQAARLRDRIMRDVRYYSRLGARLSQFVNSDADTYRMIRGVNYIQHGLFMVTGALPAAGKGAACGTLYEEWCDDWRGEGI